MRQQQNATATPPEETRKGELEGGTTSRKRADLAMQAKRNEVKAKHASLGGVEAGFPPRKNNKDFLKNLYIKKI